MRMRLLYACLALSLLAAASMASAQSKSAMAWTLMDKSGLEVTIDSIPKQFLNGIERASQRNPLPDGVKEAFRKTGKQVFAAEPIREKVHSRLVERISEEDMQEVLHFLDTELGRKVVAMEKAISSPAAIRKAMQQVSTLRKQYRKDNPERIELVEQYISATKATKVTTDLTLNIQTAITAGMVKALSPEKAPSLSEIRKQMEKNRFRVEGRVGQLLSAQFLYAYREASNQEMRDYLAFLNGDVGKLYTRQLSAILDEVLTGRARTFGERFAGKLRKGEDKAAQKG